MEARDHPALSFPRHWPVLAQTTLSRTWAAAGNGMLATRSLFGRL
jgi:hypothetical protein